MSLLQRVEQARRAAEAKAAAEALAAAAAEAGIVGPGMPVMDPAASSNGASPSASAVAIAAPPVETRTATPDASAATPTTPAPAGSQVAVAARPTPPAASASAAATPGSTARGVAREDLIREIRMLLQAQVINAFDTLLDVNVTASDIRPKIEGIVDRTLTEHGYAVTRDER